MGECRRTDLRIYTFIQFIVVIRLSIVKQSALPFLTFFAPSRCSNRLCEQSEIFQLCSRETECKVRNQVSTTDRVSAYMTCMLQDRLQVDGFFLQVWSFLVSGEVDKLCT